ncbi:receptor-like protein 7 [Tripterygium wilfordii]|uniref:receptor-like protein 7 n=1 Tax=Tripterygium wilfordii TaxID=458696 RepID=UPI0018F80511|nr:receptor-like protein 7 [Tripterygium wilfordii]
MASSLQKYPSGFLALLFLASSFLPMHVSNSTPPHCHNDESFALLQFNQSFVLDRSASFDPSSYPKVISWNQRGDCCLWDGIECDEITDHVIGLDLSSSWLYGSISSNSSLFNLVHLQGLNLADNDFNHSRILSEFRYLSHLTYPNLASSGFHGHKPSEISQLTRLTSLYLTGGVDGINGRRLLELKVPGLERLVQNLTHIQEIYLDNVDISSTVPDNMGQIPASIGNLHSLTTLAFALDNFGGPLPSSLGNLTNLSILGLIQNHFFGQIPSSFANLTELTNLTVSNNNNLTCGSLSWLSEKTKLTLLSVGQCSINGEIPHVIEP